MESTEIIKSILWIIIVVFALAFSLSFAAFVAFVTSDIQQFLRLIAVKVAITTLSGLP